MKFIRSINEYNKFLANDSKGYDIGKYVYHVTPSKNLNYIKENGFIPRDGITIGKTPFENRLYFATSLISAYDLSVNFSSYRDCDDYTIFKLDSNCIRNFEEDPLFEHGIYVDYKVSKDFIVDIVIADDLFSKYDENDLENLYL